MLEARCSFTKRKREACVDVALTIPVMNWKHLYFRRGPLILLALLSGCASLPNPEQRRTAADTLAKAQGWQLNFIAASPFTLMTYAPARQLSADHLTVYIEGDGLAWVARDLPSRDPTPLHPQALQLALAQPSGNVAYLGRPCQYVNAASTGCPQRYWTEKRFALEVIVATNAALDHLKQQFGARTLTLVGYSGGASVALLSAARRLDVMQVITVAGNLDHRAWTAFHRVRPLDGSLDPADESDALRTIPQVHFAGERDRTIPPSLIENYASRFKGPVPITVVLQPGFDHQCCWVQSWPKLWRQAVQ